ncbi:MAG TPA: peptide chain release factor N(5)-glutamine methyltransferase [Bdellovibrionales bacterium]|nr:peptide chain release factor N(5)-glutamine methyltransferase [Bdellovibrionales bacterium]
MKTHAQLHAELARKFKDAGMSEASREARVLMAEYFKLDLAAALMRGDKPVEGTDERAILAWGAARARGEPLAYLSKRRGFYKHEFLVEPGVLVPRPETELAVEIALKRAPTAKRVADLGAGTGCLGLSVISDLPSAGLETIDLSPLAVKITRQNAGRLNLSDRVIVHEGPVESWKPKRKFDLVTANPPYIPESDPNVEPGVHAFEPHLALYSGADGLEALRAWSAWAFEYLNHGGIFVCEFGAGQSARVLEIIRTIGFQEIEIVRDLAGIERVVSARK